MARCTGVTATWCPVCGDCSCPIGDDSVPTFNDPDCPLHGQESLHGNAMLEDDARVQRRAWPS